LEGKVRLVTQPKKQLSFAIVLLNVLSIACFALSNENFLVLAFLKLYFWTVISVM